MPKKDKNRISVIQKLHDRLILMFFYEQNVLLLPLVAASKYKSQYRKGIGMTADKNLTLPDIIYLLMNVS